MEKILVVNNDFDTMHLLKKWLEKKAYKVDYTSNSDAVPLLVRDFKPSLILVDVLHNEVVDQIKNNEETRDVPVLLMTGYTSKVTGHEIPFDDIIEKPFNLPLLQQKIRTLITTH